jgi:preprotein translocase SecE subunit
MPASTSDSRAGEGKAGGVVTRKKGFLSESIEELRKVTSPTRQETIQATIVTLILIVFFALILAVFDFVFRGIMWRVM